MREQIKQEIKRWNQEHLKEKRQRHVDAVAVLARELAELYGVDPDKAEFAALCHDMFRNESIELLNEYIEKGNFSKTCLNSSNLAHGKAAAYELEHRYGITDADILNAVSYHTTGRAGMSNLEKIVYLADATEPGRNYPGVQRLRSLMKKDLDRACLRSLSRTINYVTERGQFLDPDTLAARNDLLRKIKSRKEKKG